MINLLAKLMILSETLLSTLWLLLRWKLIAYGLALPMFQIMGDELLLNFGA